MKKKEEMEIGRKSCKVMMKVKQTGGSGALVEIINQSPQQPCAQSRSHKNRNNTKRINTQGTN